MDEEYDRLVPDYSEYRNRKILLSADSELTPPENGEDHR
jgi:hypothetical protein